MQAQATSHMCAPSTSCSSHTARAFAAPSPCSTRRQQPRGRATRPPQALNLIPGLTTAALIGGAWLLQQQQQQGVEQDALEASDRRPCPSCGGSGLQPCACTRWSDGDVGCSTCSESGWMKCSSCGGGGTAVPIRVSIRKTDQP